MGDPIGTGVVTGAVTRIYTPHTGTFRKGKPGGPGRPRGARNRVGAELAKEILQAAADTGFMVRDEHGNWKASNEGGVRGYLRWATINEGRLPRCMPQVFGPTRGGRPAGLRLERYTLGFLKRKPAQDHDHSSAVLTVLQGCPTPKRPRTRP